MQAWGIWPKVLLWLASVEYGSFSNVRAGALVVEDSEMQNIGSVLRLARFSWSPHFLRLARLQLASALPFAFLCVGRSVGSHLSHRTRAHLHFQIYSKTWRTNEVLQSQSAYS